MKNIKNVVQFSELCMFAEQEKIAFYNGAHNILDKEFYPQDGIRILYKCEIDQYTDSKKAIDILTRYMDYKKVKYINIVKG